MSRNLGLVTLAHASPRRAQLQLLLSALLRSVMDYMDRASPVLSCCFYSYGDTMKRTVLTSVLTASMVLSVTGCGMWPGQRESSSRSSAMTMQQCRDHMAMSGNPSTRKDDMTTRRDAECAAMMRR